MNRRIYALIPVGVGAHPPAGVYTSTRRARAAAKRLWEKSDGYHTFEVWPLTLDETYKTFPLGYSYRMKDGKFTSEPLPEVPFAHQVKF